MSFLTELDEALGVLTSRRELDVARAELPAVARSLSDAVLLQTLAEAARVANDVERLRVVCAGVVAERSARELGGGGMAASGGHRRPEDLVQAIGGGTRAEARRHVLLGTTLLETTPTETTPGTENASAAIPDWRQPLRVALLDGSITAAQHEAIQRGLAAPPDAADPTESATVWRIAAEQLIVEARSGTPVEELLSAARTARDLLDPAGADVRFQRRFEARSFRIRIDQDGTHHGHVVFDDEAAAWVRSILDSALRPRRGGPRFYTDEERAAANTLINDPRTNDQLAYDLLIDILRAGARADAKSVFGARQPGVRMVVVKDATDIRDTFHRPPRTGHLEDGGSAIPGTVIDRTLCDSGSVNVTVDSCGNPLDVGREHRLFTPRQKLALAVRDGGCLWPACDRPASYCESHHIDPYAQGGKTDIDRGVLLCRYHHLLLHNQGWRITREHRGPFQLNPPGHAAPIRLTSKSPLRWDWDPPPDRPGWRSPPYPGAPAAS
jgi:hypothetical protein